VLPSTRIESRCEEGLVDKKVSAGEGEVKGSDLLTLPEKRERREPQSPDDERSDTV
jgi:hypothetical protein